MDMEEKAEYVEAESIGKAYFKALESIVNNRLRYQYLIVHISKPVVKTENLPESFDVKKWTGFINLEDDIYRTFAGLDLIKDSCLGGSAGQDWINDRILALFELEYSDRIHKDDQLQNIIKRLQARDKKSQKMHGGSTNVLVCQVFQMQDPKEAGLPRPGFPKVTCLTQIDFKPKKDKLNLFAVYRSQYFNNKAYGNFISLAILLCKMCEETGYNPGFLVSTANNVTLDGLALKTKWKSTEACTRVRPRASAFPN